jgi:hypothetical protein
MLIRWANEKDLPAWYALATEGGYGGIRGAGSSRPRMSGGITPPLRTVSLVLNCSLFAVHAGGF